MTLKLSRADAVRPAALDEVDRSFGRKMNALLGPMAALHSLKRAQAEKGEGVLLDDDADAILRQAADQDEKIASLDKQRRGIKDQIRACATAAEIKAILASLPA